MHPSNFVNRDAVLSVRGKPTLTSTGWSVDGPLDLGEWLHYGRRLGTLGRSVHWWIGDWLRYGNACYGERYSRAARATGYDAQTLMNMVYVASRFDPARRREGLSWSHHAEVAALDPEQQDRWLALAEQQRLSVHSLRLELRAFRKASGQDSGHVGEAPRDESPHIVCPNCRHIIEPSQERPRLVSRSDER
jgi:hypothetical protein